MCNDKCEVGDWKFVMKVQSALSFCYKFHAQNGFVLYTSKLCHDIRDCRIFKALFTRCLGLNIMKGCPITKYFEFG